MALTAGGLFYELHEGPTPEAATVILSAGLGGAAGFWAPQMAALTERFRVIGYDHRGTGRSVRALTEPHSVDAMARDIVEILDAAGTKRAHLIGHAAGGLAGLALALAHPERLDRLVVVNAWAAPDPHIRRCFEVRLALLNDSGPAAYVHAQPLFLYPAAWFREMPPGSKPKNRTIWRASRRPRSSAPGSKPSWRGISSTGSPRSRPPCWSLQRPTTRSSQCIVPSSWPLDCPMPCWRSSLGAVTPIR